MRDFLKEVEAGSATKSPEASAQANMRPKLIKRFYKLVTVEPFKDGFTALLDGKSIKTPGRNAIVFPTIDAAQLFANEWDAQETEINPITMPITRLAYTAIDGIALDPQDVFEDVVKFSNSDLLYYRADSPQDLVDLQSRHWDPILDWVTTHTGAKFNIGEGMIHIPQPEASVKLFTAKVSIHSTPMKLACLHTFTSLSGSALIALALAERFLDVDTAWAAAHVDEDFNISRWGEDEDAQKRQEYRFGEMKAAQALFATL